MNLPKFRRKRKPSDFQAEIEAHLELEAARLKEQGLSDADARLAARRAFGNVARAEERFYESGPWLWWEQLCHDLRHGWRPFLRSPGFTAIAILTLALGIGANAAIFTLTYAVVLKGLPVPDPGRLVRYTFRNGAQDLGLSGPSYDALVRHESVDGGILAWAGADFAIEENGVATAADGALMSGNGFRVLELQPLLGRVFGEQDDVAGGGRNGYQALLGYNFWRNHFQTSQEVLGRTLAVNGRPVTVIGVLPPGFDGLIADEHADLVLPLAFDDALNPPAGRRRLSGSFWLTVIGRLKRGESVESANANLEATLAAVRREADPTGVFLRGFFAPFRFGVESGRAGRSALKVAYERPLLALEFLAGLLLALCCANIALLVLARVSGRERELGVRAALGAPRGRLFRQVLIEVGWLAACGLGLGIALGWAGAKLLLATFAPLGQAPSLDVAPRAALLAFTAAASILSALAAGLWPAWRAARLGAAASFREGTAGPSSKRIGGWIVPAQVAVSVVLLVSASLLGRTLLQLLAEHAGFRANGVVMADIDLGSSKLPPARVTAAAGRMLDALAAAPGVEAATAMSDPPIHGWYSASNRSAVGAGGVVRTDMLAWPEAVSPDYFTVMGTRIREGRSFRAADKTGPRICILSDSAARYFFPGEDAIGKLVYDGGSAPAASGKNNFDATQSCRVVGLAEDARFRSLRDPPPRMIYEPIRSDNLESEFFLAVRGPGAAVAAAALRDAVERVMPSAAQPPIFTFEQLVRQNLRTERLLVALSAAFAGVALLLTAVGLYGLLARMMAARTREIGLRVALGATRRDVLNMALGRGFRLALVGIGLGLGGALGLTRLLASLLYGVRPDDPATFLAVSLLLAGVALLASYYPARRAANADPMTALRHD